MTPYRFLWVLIIIFSIFIIALIIYLKSAISGGLPSLEELENPKQNIATQVISSDGKVLDHYYIERRIPLLIDSIPKDFINALIATEDKNFYNHWGVHTSRIFTAALKNIFAFRAKEGASTITMQLARNLYFNRDNTLKRKLLEAMTAIQIERTYTKNEILELYCNTVAFGRGAYGIQVASKVYFNKNPYELTTSECAFLVGLLKAPERYNGIVEPQRAIQRRDLVLSLMYDQGYLSGEQYNKALAEPINLSIGKIPKYKTLIAPHFVEMVRQELSNDPRLGNKDLYRDGLIIYTTLDSRIQNYAEQAVEQHLKYFQKTFENTFSWANNKKLLDELIRKAIQNSPQYISASNDKKKNIEISLSKNQKFIDSVKNTALTIQVGLVVIDPSDGAILAMVGASPKFMQENPDAKYSLNHVTQIRRQVGSSFKPFVYATVLKKGLTPETEIECSPFTTTLPSGEVWSPKGGCDCGPGCKKPLSYGLGLSINSMAARLIVEVTTPQEVINTARDMGIKSSLRAVPALALGGGGELSPFEMTNAFATLANEGTYIEPYFIQRIEDQYGNILYERKQLPQTREALPINVAHQMTQMLKGVVQFGTAWRIKNYLNGVEAAGKTGTTNDFADAWFIGYTPQLVAGVWVGFDDQRITFTGNYGQGGSAAAPIWGIMMGKIYADNSLPYKQRRFAFIKSDSTDSIPKTNPENIYENYFPQQTFYNNNNRKIKEKQKIILKDIWSNAFIFGKKNLK